MGSGRGCGGKGAIKVSHMAGVPVTGVGLGAAPVHPRPPTSHSLHKVAHGRPRVAGDIQKPLEVLSFADSEDHFGICGGRFLKGGSLRVCTLRKGLEPSGWGYQA